MYEHVDPDSLFVSDNENANSLFITDHKQPPVTLQDKTTVARALPQYNADTMESLKRARDLKASIENNIAILQPQAARILTRPSIEEDPENALILTLRQEHSLPWGEIATQLNNARRERGEPATFTDTMVYSRFLMSSTRVATAAGEIGFHPKDYQYLRNPTMFSSAQGGEVRSKAGRKRVKNFNEAVELKDNLRQTVGAEAHKELQSVQKTEQLMQAVAKVERNFWVLVADEMERDSTRRYEPDALADRYHAI